MRCGHVLVFFGVCVCVCVRARTPTLKGVVYAESLLLLEGVRMSECTVCCRPTEAKTSPHHHRPFL